MRIYLGAALLLIIGCVNTIRFPPDLNVWEWETADTGWWNTQGTQGTTDPTGPTGSPRFVRIERVFGGCNLGEPGLIYEVITNRWTGGAVFDVLRSSDDHRESHPLRVVDLDPEEGWEWLAVGPLEGPVPPEAFEPEINTVVDCEAEDEQLAFAVRLRNAAGETEDCVLWSNGPEGLVEELEVRLVLEDEAVGSSVNCSTIEP